jgi:hypothetical protein
MAIYRQATEFVNAFLKGDQASGSKIKELNEKIKARNAQENISVQDAFTIRDQVLLAFRMKLEAALSNYQTHPDDQQWVKEILNAQEGLETLKRVNSYPNEWVLPIPMTEKLRAQMEQVRDVRHQEKVDIDRQFGGTMGAQSSSSTSQSTNGHPSAGAAETSPGEAARPSHSSNSKGKGRADNGSTRGNGVSSSASHRDGQGRSGETPSTQNSSSVVTPWRPGLTEQGERILAYAPVEVEGADGKRAILRCKFVVEKKGRRNPIEFQDDIELGPRATQGYLNLPAEERVDIRTKSNKYSRADRKGFDKIIAVTPAYSDNPLLYPPVAVWAQWQDKSRKVMNRTGVREIYQSGADRKIEDFFEEIGEKIPWPKRAHRPGHVKAIEASREGSGAYRDTTRTRAREMVRTTRSPSRRRSLSRSSSGSFSDEGLRRLEALETKMIEQSEDGKKQILDLKTGFDSAIAEITRNMGLLMARLPAPVPA